MVISMLLFGSTGRVLEVKSQRYLGLPRGFFVSLCLHQCVTSASKLYACGRMDGIIYAVMQRDKAAQQRTISRVDDGIDL